MTFYQVVEEVKKLSAEEIEEPQILPDKYMIEKRRDEILKSYEDAKKQVSEGKLRILTSVDEFEKELNRKD